MVIQLNWEVWVNDGEAKVGRIIEIKSEYVVIETIHGKRIAADREKIRPISELYGVVNGSETHHSTSR